MKTAKLSMLLVAALCAVAFDASAATTRKWCTTWKTNYVDAGFGENHFTQTGPSNRPAQYAWGQLVNLDTNQTVWTGYFDGSGCTPYLPVAGFTNYELRQGTKLERVNRTFLVVHSGAPTGDWSSWYYYYQRVQTGLVVINSQTTTTLNLAAYNPHTNVLPVLGRILYLYSTMEYPSGTVTAVRTDDTACSGSYYWTGTGRVCVAGNYNNQEDHTTWKYIIAHEIGHRQAEEVSGPMSGSYTASVSELACKCDHVSGDDMNRWHCLQSREYIATAQTEGWAQFYATRLFNNQTEGAGKFVYYKEFLFAYPDWWVALPPIAFNAYYNATWMETHCLADDRGVELDWLNFFWNVHTGPEASASRLSVDELTNVWASASSPYRWDDELIPALSVALPGDWGTVNFGKKLNFADKGQGAGVAH